MATPRWAVLRQNSAAENLHLAPVNNSDPAQVNYNSGMILEPGGELVIPGKGNMRVSDEINYLKSSVANGKYAIAQAISGRGIPTAGGEDFSSMAAKINQISPAKREANSGGWVPITRVFGYENATKKFYTGFRPRSFRIDIKSQWGYMSTQTNELTYSSSASTTVMVNGTIFVVSNGFDNRNGMISYPTGGSSYDPWRETDNYVNDTQADGFVVSDSTAFIIREEVRGQQLSEWCNVRWWAWE